MFFHRFDGRSSVVGFATSNNRRGHYVADHGVIRMARLSDYLQRQIAIGNDTDQLFVLIIVDYRHGPDIFAPHYSRGLTDGIARQATNRIVGHDFPAIHRNLPDFERSCERADRSTVPATFRPITSLEGLGRCRPTKGGVAV